MADAKGGGFYKEHLPIFGVEQAANVFEVSDRVLVDLEVDVIKMLQNGHGGWSEGMKEVGTRGIVCNCVFTLISPRLSLYPNPPLPP